MTRSSVLARNLLTCCALTTGCYTTVETSQDASAAAGDTSVDASRVEHDDDSGPASDVWLGERAPPLALVMARFDGAEACPDWDPLTHPSPAVPHDASETPTLAWTYRNDAEPYVGGARFARDGSLRVLGPGARRFVRIERDGTIAWDVDAGGYGYVWALAPDGSLFVSPGDDEGVHRRLVQIDADGHIVANIDVPLDHDTSGIGGIAIGPHGRVYLSNGSVIATCRGVREWSLEARAASGDARRLELGAIDAEGSALAGAVGSARALRVSSDGLTREWIGEDYPLSAADVDFTVSAIGPVEGTSVVVGRSTRGYWSYSLVRRDMPPVPAPSLMAFDGLGRIVHQHERGRMYEWEWEQGDGTSVTISPCQALTFLDDGGALCTVSGPDGRLTVLRRITSDTRIAWEVSAPSGASINLLAVDLDGRVALVSQEGVHGEGAVYVLQTRMRPATARAR